MYGWITPKRRYIEVPKYQHHTVINIDEEAKEAYGEDFTKSVYHTLWDKGFIRVANDGGGCVFEGKSRHIADARQKLTVMAESHGLDAEFDTVE